MAQALVNPAEGPMECSSGCTATPLLQAQRGALKQLVAAGEVLQERLRGPSLHLVDAFHRLHGPQQVKLGCAFALHASQVTPDDVSQEKIC